MPVEHNFANSIAGHSFLGCGEEVAEACDYVGGDLYGNLYNHSFACKYFLAASRNQPFEQMFSRCKPALKTHTLTKTPDEMRTALSVTMSHHGATLVIDAIDPVGTMDERVYRQVGDLFRFQEQYEPWFQGSMVQDVGIYYGLRSRTKGDTYTSLDCCKTLGQTLIRAHIPFGVTGSFASLEGYPIIAAPVLSRLEEKDNDRLVRYVEQGGTLYLSGCENEKLVHTLTGHQYLRTTEEKDLYIAPAKGSEALFRGFTREYPLPFEGTAPVVEAGQDCTVLATLTFPYTKPNELRFASIHSNPPGIPTEIPAVTVSRYGKGCVIWSAAPLEAVAYTEHGNILLGLLRLGKEMDFSFTSNAPVNVEITAFRYEGGMTVNAAVLWEESDSIPVAPFSLRVKTEAAPKEVALLPGDESIPFTYENGYCTFQTRKLHIFDMYRIALYGPYACGIE